MAIQKSVFLNEIKNDLAEYGDYVTTDGEKLEVSLYYAMRDFWEKRDWSFRFATGTLTASEGVQGPYDPPSGFESLVTPEAVSRYFDYDRFSVPPPIPDSSNGYKYDITYDRLNSKIWFRWAPDAGTYTFYYRRALEGTDDLSLWPDAARRFLQFQTKGYVLFESSDTRKDAADFFEQAKVAYKSMLDDMRRGESKQDSRDPRDPYGYSISQSMANEGDGFLGGI